MCKSTSKKSFIISSKRPHPKDLVKKSTDNNEFVHIIIQTKQTKIQFHLHLKPKTNLGGISDKNLGDRLVRLVQELAKLVTKTNNKVQELKTCDKAISNLIYGNR